MNLVVWIGLVAGLLLAGTIIFILIKKSSGTRSLFKAQQEAKEILDPPLKEYDIKQVQGGLLLQDQDFF